METAGAVAVRSPLHALVLALGPHLRWLAYLSPDKEPRIIPRPETDSAAAVITQKLEVLKDFTPELCRTGAGTLVFVHAGETFVVFCDQLMPWLILNVQPTITLDDLRATLDTCVQTHISRRDIQAGRNQTQKQATS